MDGKRYTFTAEQVAQIAADYDPACFSAPCVIGHPKHDDPAYGWAQAMSVNDKGVLVAEVDKINPAFADLVESGAYQKISLSFYPPDHGNNPKPGTWYPRHVGFLGAAAPGVQGLAPVAFAEGDDQGVVEFATDAELRPMVWLARHVHRLFRRVREQTIDEKGLEEADKILPEWEVEGVAEVAGQLDRALDGDTPRFAAPTDPVASAVTDADIAAAELASREQAVADREAAVGAREVAFTQGERQRHADEDDALLEGLIDAGRLPPGLKTTVAAFCEALDGSDAVSFAEGEAAIDPRIGLRNFLQQHLGVSIRFDEVAGDGASFAEGPSAQQLASVIQEEMRLAEAAGNPISAAEASRRAKARL